MVIILLKEQKQQVFKVINHKLGIFFYFNRKLV